MNSVGLVSVVGPVSVTVTLISISVRLRHTGPWAWLQTLPMISIVAPRGSKGSTAARVCCSVWVLVRVSVRLVAVMRLVMTKCFVNGHR